MRVLAFFKRLLGMRRNPGFEEFDRLVAVNRLAGAQMRRTLDTLSNVKFTDPDPGSDTSRTRDSCH